MTTIKEYKAMIDGASDGPWEHEWDTVYNSKYSFYIKCADEKEALFIKSSLNITPELIRVMELARGVINQGNFTYLGAEYVFCASPEKVKELEEKIKILTGE